MRAQHVIALSGPPPLVIVRGNYAAQQALLSPPDRNSFGTETDPKPTGESAPRSAGTHKKP